jgi:hypothetical protein
MKAGKWLSSFITNRAQLVGRVVTIGGAIILVATVMAAGTVLGAVITSFVVDFDRFLRTFL